MRHLLGSSCFCSPVSTHACDPQWTLSPGVLCWSDVWVTCWPRGREGLFTYLPVDRYLQSWLPSAILTLTVRVKQAAPAQWPVLIVILLLLLLLARWFEVECLLFVPDFTQLLLTLSNNGLFIIWLYWSFAFLYSMYRNGSGLVDHLGYGGLVVLGHGPHFCYLSFVSLFGCPGSTLLHVGFP